jgi:hypothetical protein
VVDTILSRAANHRQVEGKFGHSHCLSIVSIAEPV